MIKKKRLLIVDDSKIMQKLLFAVLEKEPDFEIVAVCNDPFEAKDYITNNAVDCMILDLEMPKMDGLTFLKKIIKTHPLQIIILSAAIENNFPLVEVLIKNGAHDVFAKPNGINDTTFDQLKKSIRENYAPKPVGLLQKTNGSSGPKKILMIAASTGGTEGVKKILSNLSNDGETAVIIIQHMAAKFTKNFADSLDKNSEFQVKEAENNELLCAGTAYVASGNLHLEIIKIENNRYALDCNSKPHVHSVRPAADVTFLSFPKNLIKQTTAIVLSGMGKDGAEGISYLKKNGAPVTIAEAESSCVVFGMPKAAIDTGCIDLILPIDEICKYLQVYSNQ